MAGILVAALLAQSVWAAPSSEELKKEQAGKQAELDALSAESAQLDDELNSYAEQISQTKKDQEKTAAALEKAQAEVEVQYASMGDRIRFMYEDGSISLLEVLFDSDDMGDFLNRAYYISTISDYDRNMLKELEAASDKVKKEQETLKKNQKELEALQADRLEKQASLADQIARARKEVEEAKKAVEKATEAEKAAAQKALEEAQAKADSISSGSSSGSSSSGGSSSGGSSSGKSSSRGSSSGDSSSDGSSSGDSSGSWSGQKLTPSAGTIMGPSGKETYYNLDMSGVVRIMRSIGNNDKYWVRSDGVKMLGDYVMVAANFNLRPRGSHIQTSLGMGVVCDTGGFAAGNPTQLDIATDW